MQDVPYGFCHCGCGELAPIITQSNSQRGYVKGEPFRFINNHHGRRDPKERFWRKVDLSGPNGCWLWTAGRYGSRPGYQYGRFSPTPGVEVAAHRFAYELLRGPIPPGLELDHLCRNPPCVNPEHLEPVTHAENIRRAERTVVARPLMSHCLRGHPYDEANTYHWNGHRYCRACRRERSRKYGFSART